MIGYILITIGLLAAGWKLRQETPQNYTAPDPIWLPLAIVAAVMLLSVGVLGHNVSDQPAWEWALGLIANYIGARWVYEGLHYRSTQNGQTSHGFGVGGGAASEDPAFDFDPSRFADQQDAPASSSRDVATVGADNDETDERLWRMAQDPRTPEGERQAAMKAIQRRGKPIPRTRKR